MIDSRTLEKIEAIEERTWGVIYKELVRYANFKLKKGGFEIRTEMDSVDAEHFATLAIERVLDGTRKWDFERFPDITYHLMGVVKSLISSHFKSSSRSIVKAGSKVDLAVTAGNEDEVDEQPVCEDSQSTESPEEVFISTETWNSIENAFGEKKDDHAIFCEWIDGTPPRKIAEVWEIPVSEINNAIKRGTRIVNTLFNKQS